jgi:hypothetical protein
MRRGTVALVVLLAVLCCLAAAVGGLAYLFYAPTVEARPVVLINSPSHGEQVQVGDSVTVQAVARDQGEVTRVELWVDGQLHETQRSTVPGGISPFPMVTQWQPLYPGTHRLTARAFNAQGARAHASINLEATAEADQDGDGVTDQQDLCPDERGWSASSGCPDRDYDGIPDAEDACPDEAGLPDGDGCPTPGDGDRDGDGVLDDVDACPGEAGAPVAEGCPDADGDRVADAQDACPTEPGWHENDGCPTPGDLDFDGVSNEEDDCAEEWGLPEHSGCSDDDGDGVPDRADACLDEPGLPERDGCPDRDGDGVPDPDDLRPDEPGIPEDHGAPDSGAPDSDGDGVPDDIDECDHEEGLPEHVGCPPPGEAEDADGDGIADDEEGPEGPLDPLLSLVPLMSQVVPLVPKDDIRIEFQALEFSVGRNYDGVGCYVRVGNMDPIHPGSFDVSGRRSLDLVGRSVDSLGETWQWDIADDLGSVATIFSNEEPFPVYVECDAWVHSIVCSEDVGTCIIETEEIDLGSFRGGYPDTAYAGYPREDWEGLVITGRSDGGSSPDDWFELSFRICAFSCEEVMYQPPVIELVDMSISGVTQKWLLWTWHGDLASISDFNVYANDNHVRRVSRRFRGVSVQDFPPGCDFPREFQVTVQASDRESPRSNTVIWESGRACERRLRVEFDTLQTRWLGDDERDHDDVGPIHGNFRVSSGGRTQWLEFDAVDVPRWWEWRETTGYRLDQWGTDSVGNIFNWIWTRMNCMGHCPDYFVSAGGQNYLLIELPEDDLSFGGSIWDHDDDNEDDLLFDADYTIQAEDIEEFIGELRGPDYIRQIEDRGITLWVRVNLIIE